MQQLLGLTELDSLYEATLRAQQANESIFDALLRTLRVTYDVAALDLARIPLQGGAIVVANHPFGMIEGVIMNALLQRVRPDARVLANSLLARYPEIAKSLILVDPFGNHSATLSNRQGLRESLAWLKRGGILGVFPAGEVASLQLRKARVVDPPWNESIVRLATLASVPVLPLFFAGRNQAPFQVAGLIHSRLRTALLIREFLNKQGQSIPIRIGNLIGQQKLEELNGDLERIEYVRRKTYILANRQEPPRPLPFVIVNRGKRIQPETTGPVNIVKATDPVLIQREISALPASALLVQQGDSSVYIGRAAELPNVVREIGRLREITFRKTGEGTGRSIDLDEFDTYYLHLFIWNSKNCEIVGAYRIGQSDSILREVGRRGLYTSTLFSYKRKFLEAINPALEMGRSFVRVEYQRSYAPLLLLWRGIGAFVCRNPQYRFLFGPVSISNDYHPGSRQLMVNFLKEYCRADDLAHLVRARSPFRTRPLQAWDDPAPADFTWDIEELSAFVADIETDQKGVPVLLRQYLKLGGKLVGFNVDRSFSNALDGLIVIDLLKTDDRLVERYLGVDGAASFFAYHRSKVAVAR
jgi:putative hemolysin